MARALKGSFILLTIFLGLLTLAGCNIPLHFELNQAIDQYQAAESKVKLGDNKEEVLAILQPTQANLSGGQSRAREYWIDPKSGKGVDLYYFRSSRTAGPPLKKAFDEELTPYLFIDNTLVAVGWNAVRGIAIQP